MKRCINFFFFLFSMTGGFGQPDTIIIGKGLLDSLSASIENGNYSNVDGIVISKNGKIYYEKYFNGFTRDSLHDIRSSFKSITGLLTGIAIDRGLIKNVHEKVYSFFPEYKIYTNRDHRKEKMTIEHLLEMKSGYNCEEWNGTNDCEAAMTASNDWIKFSLDLPLLHAPGTAWNYTSSNAMLLGGIIANASKISIMEFAGKYLFEPLGITNYRWSLDPAGHGMTAGSFYILPMDMIKIGMLVLNNGMWKDERIISQKWISQATGKITKIENFSNVKISTNKSAIPQPTFYGYTWYNESIQTNKGLHNVVFASGNGGQYIMIIKDLDLVIAFTGNSYNSSKSKLPFDILIRYILPYFDEKMRD